MDSFPKILSCKYSKHRVDKLQCGQKILICFLKSIFERNLSIPSIWRCKSGIKFSTESPLWFGSIKNHISLISDQILDHMCNISDRNLLICTNINIWFWYCICHEKIHRISHIINIEKLSQGISRSPYYYFWEILFFCMMESGYQRSYDARFSLFETISYSIYIGRYKGEELLFRLFLYFFTQFDTTYFGKTIGFV